MALVYEVLITVVYWCLLHDSNDSDAVKVSMHIVPLVLLAIDFAVSRIVIEKWHVWPNLVVLIIYGLVNIA
jgi:hypothetical protein